ncbi:MAG: carbamoyltransferase N-terminal domain-containing protein [Acidobacteriota bacterium]|nr:carbamoyltransferase N-terminal domain-containing protein [Acidobacteriota bacterium]
MVCIVGLSAFYHDASCCLMVDGNLVAAAQEERFTRVKNDPRTPVNAFRYCLEEAGLDITDIDCLAYYESPGLKTERQRHAAGVADDDSSFDPQRPVRAIREKLGWRGPVRTYEHHRSHAASAYFFSGFQDAALLTVDGVGEWATTSYGYGGGSEIDLFAEVRFPHSLGLLYAAVTAFLGFKVNSGEYKVMGLAPYGDPKYTARIRRLVENKDAGDYHLNMEYFDYVRGDRMYSDALIELLGCPPREPESEILPVHTHIAASMQQVLEEILLQKANWLAEKTGAGNLCMAGGVALNCVANGRIRRETPFRELFIQPAAGDAGACLGAAALAHIDITGKRHSETALDAVYLGPAWSGDRIEHLLVPTGIPAHDFRNREADLIAFVAERLVKQQTVGWFHGRMEFGPRALGARSILANPLDPNIRDRLNKVVKKRESFRPFAPSVLLDHAGEHFQLEQASPFMLETCRVRSALKLPGITHINGSARPQTVTAPQNPRYAALIAAFQARTGCPLLVNTSFNVRGEPIVCSPADALLCMANSELDLLVLEDFVIERHMLPAHLEALLEVWLPADGGLSGGKSAVSEHLYTFV